MSRNDSQFRNPNSPYPPNYSREGHPNPNMRRPPRQSGSKKIWIWVAGSIGLFFLCCCGGGFGLGFFALNLISSEIETILKDHPQFVETFGEVKSFKINLTKSAAIDAPNTFVFDVKGTRRSGTIIVESLTNDFGDEEIVSARIVDEAGVERELDFPDN